MKSKLLISLLLALAMVFTLTLPALAGKPAKLEVEVYNSVPVEVVGKCSVQATHNNELKITVSLSGALPGTYYIKWASASINNPSPASVSGATDPVSFTVNDSGRGRFSGIASNSGYYQFSDYLGEWGFRLFIYDNQDLTNPPIYESENNAFLWVTFK
jgi:hypothetical protein